MTNNVYLENIKYKIFSFLIAILISLAVLFISSLLKVNIYNYKMPKEIKVNLVNNIPVNKPKPIEHEQKAERKIVKPKIHKMIKHQVTHPIQKPKAVEKPIVSKIPAPEPKPEEVKPTKQEQVQPTKIQTQTTKNLVKSTETNKPSPPVSSSKPTKDQISIYLSKVYEIIEEHKHYPSLAKRRGDSGTVFIRVRISSNGSVEGVSLLNSSGSFILDEYTKALIKGLKFPPPPKGPITFDLKVNYRLNEGD